MLGALSVALVASLALLAGSAHADGVGSDPQIEWHAAFSSGQSTGLTAGTPIVLSYNNPAANTSVRQFFWSPAPITAPPAGRRAWRARPGRHADGHRALDNGQSACTSSCRSRRPTPAPTAARGTARALDLACSISLSGDAA